MVRLTLKCMTDTYTHISFLLIVEVIPYMCKQCFTLSISLTLIDSSYIVFSNSLNHFDLIDMLKPNIVVLHSQHGGASNLFLS